MSVATGQHTRIFMRTAAPEPDHVLLGRLCRKFPADLGLWGQYADACDETAQSAGGDPRWAETAAYVRRAAVGKEVRPTPVKIIAQVLLVVDEARVACQRPPFDVLFPVCRAWGLNEPYYSWRQIRDPTVRERLLEIPTVNDVRVDPTVPGIEPALVEMDWDGRF